MFSISDGANNIDEMSIKVESDKNSTQTYFVRWEEPKNPNGLIVSYSIIHSRILSDNVIFDIFIFILYIFI